MKKLVLLVLIVSSLHAMESDFSPLISLVAESHLMPESRLQKTLKGTIGTLPNVEPGMLILQTTLETFLGRQLVSGALGVLWADRERFPSRNRKNLPVFAAKVLYSRKMNEFMRLLWPDFSAHYEYLLQEPAKVQKVQADLREIIGTCMDAECYPTASLFEFFFSKVDHDLFHRLLEKLEHSGNVLRESPSDDLVCVYLRKDYRDAITLGSSLLKKLITWSEYEAQERAQKKTLSSAELIIKKNDFDQREQKVIETTMNSGVPEFIGRFALYRDARHVMRNLRSLTHIKKNYETLRATDPRVEHKDKCLQLIKGIEYFPKLIAERGAPERPSHLRSLPRELCDLLEPFYIHALAFEPQEDPKLALTRAHTDVIPSSIDALLING